MRAAPAIEKASLRGANDNQRRRRRDDRWRRTSWAKLRSDRRRDAWTASRTRYAGLTSGTHAHRGRRTAPTPRLLAAITDRSRRGPSVSTLLVPRPYWIRTPGGGGGARCGPPPRAAFPKSGRRDHGNSDPFVAGGTFGAGQFDEVIISTLPAHVSRWLRLDLLAASSNWACGDRRHRRAIAASAVGQVG